METVPVEDEDEGGIDPWELERPGERDKDDLDLLCTAAARISSALA